MKMKKADNNYYKIYLLPTNDFEQGLDSIVDELLAPKPRPKSGISAGMSYKELLRKSYARRHRSRLSADDDYTRRA